MSHPSFDFLRIPGTQLKETRIQCHYAVQLNTHLARGYLPAQADDSHTSLTWDTERQALVGGAPFHLGLRLADLTLTLPDASFPLEGKTFSDALRWLAETLSLGLEVLSKPLHFEIEDHPLAHGAVFRCQGREELFAEFAHWYANAALCLSNIAMPVRCWPHHFDIAVQISLAAERSIGAGMSPGDGSYAEPYFYVTPSPYPEASKLPSLSKGIWHTEEWTAPFSPRRKLSRKAPSGNFFNHFWTRPLQACDESKDGKKIKNLNLSARYLSSLARQRTRMG